MGDPVGKYFTRKVIPGKYGDPIVRLPEGNAAVPESSMFGGPPYTFGDRVTIQVYASNGRDGRPPTGFFAQVVRVERRKNLNNALAV